MKKGISLIVLVITIIVMIIIAGSTIMTLSNSNVIAKAKEGKAKNDISNLKQHWQRSYCEALIANAGTTPTLEQITTKFGASNVPTDFEITTTGIKYNGTDPVIIAAANDLNIEVAEAEPEVEYTSEEYFNLSDGELNVKSEYLDEYNNCSLSGDIFIPPTIGGLPVTSIANGALMKSGITSITIPSSVTTINSYAFYSNSSLTTATIPSSVTSIGVETFGSCPSLTSITIHKATNSISGSPWGATCTIIWDP